MRKKQELKWEMRWRRDNHGRGGDDAERGSGAMEDDVRVGAGEVEIA